MLFWNKYKKDELIADVMGIKLEKPVTLREAMEGFEKACTDEQNPYKINYWWKGLKAINTSRRLDTIKIGDVINADRYAKAAIQRLIHFAAAGSVDSSTYANGKSIRSPGGSAGNGDTGRLTIRPAKTADVLKLIPVAGALGTFGRFRLAVHQMVNDLPADQSGVIQWKKKNLTMKEAIRAEKNVNKMLTVEKKPWNFVYNPLENLFLLIRKADLEKQTSKKGA